MSDSYSSGGSGSRELSPLDDLIAAWLDGRLDTARVLQLEQELRASRAARRRFVEWTLLEDLLRNQLNDAERGPLDADTLKSQLDWSQRIDAVWTSVAADDLMRATSKDSTQKEFLLAEIASDGSEKSRWGEISSAAIPDSFLRQLRQPAAFGLCAVAILILAFCGWWWQTGGFSPVRLVEAPVVDPDSAPNPVGKVAPSEFVANITVISPDVQWSNSSTANDFLLRIRRGESVGLLSGLVEIQFSSGAIVILHGPAQFVATGPASGHLLSGKLHGQAENGNFELTTLSAKVIDLGTAFGVAVDSTDNTDVVVFEGDVRVSATRGNKAKNKSMHLKAGMGARIAWNGSIVQSHNPLKDSFLNVFPDVSKVDELKGVLSLVDILNANTGSKPGHSRIVCTIDPITGRSTPQPWLQSVGPGDRVGDGLYHVTTWHPFVDGVFVPTTKGKDVQINSAGHRVELPVNIGYTWGPVWSRRRVDVPLSQFENCDFWGTGTLRVLQQRFKHCQLGMVGLHANVGFSIDLAAIRNSYRVTLNGVRSIVANMDNSREWEIELGKEIRDHSRLSADLRLYVDGKLVYSRLDFGRADGEETMDVPLSSVDRYLTLVSTDAMYNSDGIAFDHVVLIDPILSITKLPPTSEQPNTQMP